ncbi:hypothetical protein CK203_044314 [Vitis vinifera]|uniref:Retrotransposon gag domain-containing protein n=1 Tax=Vitis vinifera TaxID=29760 RepID=A0A438H821_VITVI|nr:hypothetical protein CK203_044314 [Vitis vinifera]
MDTQQSRHVVLEDTPSDLVTPPVLPVQMPATPTSHTTSHDQAAVTPPIVTPVTIIEDPRSRMDRLERRIRQMRDPDEMISWDDPDDVPMATLPVGFRMPDIERYTGVGCPRIHLRLYSTVMRALGLDEVQLLTLFPLSLSGMTQRCVTRRELEFLRQRSDEPISSFISRWREKAAEMIERPTERDQMSMFLRSLHPRFARHLTGVPFQDFRSLVQALFDVDDGISRGLCIDEPGYHSYARSLQIPRSDFHLLQHRHPHLVQQYPSVHPHTVTVRPSFQFQRPQTSIPRHEQSRRHRRRQRLILIWGCLWIELLSDSDLLMAGHRTDYCASLRHTIQDLIDSGAVSFPISATDTDLGPDMIAVFFQLFHTCSSSSFGLIPSQHLETRLLQLRFTMSDEIAPITLTALYEMMVDLTRKVERIELILSGHPSSSRGAPGVAMPSLPHLTSATPATLGASHPRSSPTFNVPAAFLIHFTGYADTTSSQFRGPPVVTVPQDRFPPHRRCRRHFSDLSAPLSSSGHACRRPFPAVPDLIDLGD